MAYFGEEIGKLGFGMMRLPRRGVSIDVAQVSAMVDAFLEAGFTYFDTAFVYPGSEEATRKALVERHPRDQYTLATKLFAAMVPSEKMAKKELTTSLKRLGTDYVDYYLLHSLMESNYKKYERFHLWDFVQEEKAKGRIKHIGFSFHGGPELLDELLTEHPEVEFVQLQLNYADWNDPGILSRANYEVARKHDASIVVMEPVKGGVLANPPREIREIFKSVQPDASPASWAIRFVASLDGIITVLSGMSNEAQMRDNLSYMKEFKALNEAEMAAIQKAQQVYGNSKDIPCTSCRYCTRGCPKQIPIPDIFTIVNKRNASGKIDAAKASYHAVAGEGHRASDCVACGQCEGVCPQHIAITRELESAAKLLEG